MEQHTPAINQPTKDTVVITWGPLAAVIGTLLIYFGSMIAASIVIVLYAGLRQWNTDQAETWTSSVVGQFSFIALVEFFTVGSVWRFLKWRHASLKTLGFSRPKAKYVLYSLGGYCAYFTLLIISTVIIQKFTPIDTNQEQQIGFEAASGTGQLLLVFTALVILAPITEEILCRGFLYLGLKSRLPRYWAIFLTSAIFAVAHLQLGSGQPPLWTAAIDTFMLSVVSIRIRDATENLWPSIWLHMIKNSVAFMFLFGHLR